MSGFLGHGTGDLSVSGFLGHGTGDLSVSGFLGHGMRDLSYLLFQFRNEPEALGYYEGYMYWMRTSHADRSVVVLPCNLILLIAAYIYRTYFC